MTTRRDFISTAAASLAVATASHSAAADSTTGTKMRKKPAHPKKSGEGTAVERIKSAVLRDETILRLGGDGGWHAMTWTPDDRQLVVICDGVGWPEIPKDHYRNSCLFSVGGSPQRATFEEVTGYPDISLGKFFRLRGLPPYYALTVLSVGGRIYQCLSTSNGAIRAVSDKSAFYFNGVKLIHSRDGGHTWCNQDGSTPVVFESQQEQSRKTMMFFHEPQDAFSILSFLQMGRDYRDNRDGYTYVYSPNGTTEGSMNELVMFRVRHTQIADRQAYEYFAELRPDGSAVWVKEMNARGIVHTFPRGWVASSLFPYAWQPSVVHNAPLGVYMMTTWGSGYIDDVEETYRPSYLGFWVAPRPWGPWKQILEKTAWQPGGDPEACLARPTIAPKWISNDGKSLWIVWTDFQHTKDYSASVWHKALHAQSEAEFTRLRRRYREMHPYFGFNTQRVDLIVS